MGDVGSPPAYGVSSEFQNGGVVVTLVEYQAPGVLCLRSRPAEDCPVMHDFFRYEFYGGFGQNER